MTGCCVSSAGRTVAQTAAARSVRAKAARTDEMAAPTCFDSASVDGAPGTAPEMMEQSALTAEAWRCWSQ